MNHYHQRYEPYYLLQPTQPPPPVADRDGVNTLFVAGLPDDVKAREIHNLFRRKPGFDYCQLKYTGRGNQVVAFATFFNHQSAVAAMHSLDGVKFDPQTGSTLHIELARTNSTRKHRPGSGPYAVIDNRHKNASETREVSMDDGCNESAQGSAIDNDDPAHEEDSGNSKSEAEAYPSDAVEGGNNVQDQSEKMEDDGACSTLFIANLGPNCREDELRQALSRYPGFNAVKLRTRGAMPVAFADFEETKQASNAMEGLQDSLLPSSDRGGLHIEYARSKMRKKSW